MFAPCCSVAVSPGQPVPLAYLPSSFPHLTFFKMCIHQTKHPPSCLHTKHQVSPSITFYTYRSPPLCHFQPSMALMALSLWSIIGCMVSHKTTLGAPTTHQGAPTTHQGDPLPPGRPKPPLPGLEVADNLFPRRTM